SSRRRHTRCYRDWSSDVCSSDLGGGVRVVERVEVIADGDPLVEVLEPPPVRRQLGRADQQQRDEEAVVGLEVEQQPQLLEDGVVVDELRFVHDDDGVAPGLEVAKEDVVELMEQVGLRRTLRLDAELVE